MLELNTRDKEEPLDSQAQCSHVDTIHVSPQSCLLGALATSATALASQGNMTQLWRQIYIDFFQAKVFFSVFTVISKYSLH